VRMATTYMGMTRRWTRPGRVSVQGQTTLPVKRLVVAPCCMWYPCLPDGARTAMIE
jgi:hypothetical protein